MYKDKSNNFNTAAILPISTNLGKININGYEVSHNSVRHLGRYS